MTSTPTLPAKSVRFIIKEIKPSVSEPLVIYVAVQLFAETLVMIGEFVTTTPPDLNVTLGV